MTGKLIPFRPKPVIKLGTPIAWGSAEHHQRYMVARTSRARGRRWCSRCKKAARVPCTHAGMANGVCLMTGCEWHVRQWVRTGG